MLSRLILALPAMSLAFASGASAKTVKGPQVSHERAASADVEPKDGSDPDAKVQRNRTEANLLVPIPAEVLGGMFVLRDDFFKEHRVYEGDDTGNEPDDVKNPNVAGLGVVYLPHPKEGAPRFFLAAGRYGELSVFQDKSKPMKEYIVGADVADTDMPFALKFSATDQAESKILVRYRDFPGFHRWLLLVGHKIEQTNGFSLEVVIPSHVLATFSFGGGAWATYGGIRWVGREYPFDTGFTQGWIEGHVTTRLFGVRRQLAGPLFLALEGGVQKEELRYVDTKGEELSVHETKFAPWTKAALETWIKTP